MKTCFKCGEQKPATLEFFYRHSQMADGFLGKCKECAKQDVASRAILKRDELLAYDRLRATLPHRVTARKTYNQSSAGRLSHALALRKQIRLHPDKAFARRCVSNAIRSGKLERSPCVTCGAVKVEGHHPDYSKPLDVIWLCNRHHREVERMKG